MNKVLLEISLSERIAKMKMKLVKVAIDTGLNSNQTIKCSQELDILLNLHMKLFSQNILLSTS